MSTFLHLLPGMVLATGGIGSIFYVFLRPFGGKR